MARLFPMKEMLAEVEQGQLGAQRRYRSIRTASEAKARSRSGSKAEEEEEEAGKVSARYRPG